MIFSHRQKMFDNVIFCSAFFRKTDWDLVGGYDTDLIYGWEDYDFWLSLLQLGRQVYRIPEILFYYRVAADSMVRARPRQDKLDTFVRLYHKHQELYSENIHIWIDKLLDVREQYHEASLRIPGRADGHNKDEQLICKVGLDTDRLVFQLAADRESSDLIFSVADDYAVIRLHQCTLEQHGQRTPLTSWTSNADFVAEELFVFCNEHPEFHLTIPNNSGGSGADAKLVVELEYLSFGRDCLPVILDIVQLKKSSLAPLSWWEVRKADVKRRLKSFKYYLLNSHYRILKRSGLFDEDYYLQQDSKISPLLMDPLIHYVETGWREGRNPNPLFEADWYRQTYQISENQDSLLHYIKEGAAAGFNPNPLFWNNWYRGTYPESTGERKTPLADYRGGGWQLGRNPNPLFDSLFYAQQYAAELGSSLSPLEHYLVHGFRQQIAEKGFFDVAYYLEDNPSVAALCIPLLMHYVQFGADEGRSPNRFFDPEYYKKINHLDRLSGVDLFIHFVEKGSRQNFRPSEFFDPEFYAATYPESSAEGAHPLLHYQKQGIFSGCYPCREVAELSKKPLISILTPVYDSDEQLLRRCIHSVLYQAYPHWELCLVDDGSSGLHIRPLLEEYAARDKRIKIRFLAENQGISTATNTAAELAGGDYVAFLDHDDELTLDALYRVVDAVNRKDFDVCYTDEVLVDRESRHLERFYKPDFNPELLLCHNYINHLLVIRRSLFERAGGLSTQCVGAQDYDLLLKVTEYTEKIHHLRHALYKWRAIETSTSINHGQKDYADAAGLRALQAAVTRRGIQADVRAGHLKYYYEVLRSAESKPLVSVIALGEEDVQETISWLEHLLKQTGYQNFEMHLLSRCSGAAVINDDVFEKVTLHHVTADESEALALNRVAGIARGEHLVFIRQGILPQEDTWLEILLGYSLTEKFGVVGGMVSRDNDQHENLAIPDTLDFSCRLFRSFLTLGSCHLNGIVCPQNVLAVSFDFCMVHAVLFQKAAGFDVEHFSQSLYDIDLCLRLRGEGVEHVLTPFCRVVYQRRNTTDSRIAQCDSEKNVFQKRWQDILIQNPYYNEQRLVLEQSVSNDDWQNWVAGV